MKFENVSIYSYIVGCFVGILLIYPNLIKGQSRKKLLDCPPAYSKIPFHTACFNKSSEVISSGISPTDRKTILDEHNRYRNDIQPTARDMSKLIWNNELAMIAQKWAESCYFNNDYRRYVPGRFDAGQNIARGLSSWKDVLKTWHDEYKYFTYGNQSLKAYNYSQMVWAQTTAVGCGYAECANIQKFYVCNYAPPGRSGEKPYEPYKKGAPAADCPFHQSGNLCDCGLICNSDSKLDVGGCICDCQLPKIHKGQDCKADCDLAKVHEPKDSCDFYIKSVGCVAFFVQTICPVRCGLCLTIDLVQPGGASVPIYNNLLILSGIFVSIHIVIVFH